MTSPRSLQRLMLIKLSVGRVDANSVALEHRLPQNFRHDLKTLNGTGNVRLSVFWVIEPF
jgi:hypothetical protein